ncbi:ATP-binding protein [Noviherbaspirillum aerium]|uniref:ATP-binding protein n=1 Tax=Noviherbaspirillum aerium TaxID=2588497 RepID=UPI00124F6EE1|nr:ATP-binding protein [Noviherbaspirillum aerium]
MAQYNQTTTEVGKQPLPPPSSVPLQFRPNLRLRFAVALAVTVLTLALGIAAVLENVASREVAKLSAQNLENISRQMAREISTGMSRFAIEIETQAQIPTLRNPSTKADDMRSILDRFVAHHPEFSYLGVIDVDSARVLAANAGLFEGGSATGRPIFENGKKGLFLGDVHPAVRLAELLPKPPSGDGLRFLDVSVPILDDGGQPTRVLAGHISFEWTRQLREQVLAPIRDARGIEIMLVDTTGKIVLTPNEEIKVGQPIAELVRTNMTDRAELHSWANGLSYLTTSARVIPDGAFDGFGWRVVARQPEEFALAPASRLRDSFFFGAALLGALAAVLAWAAAGRITRPVYDLANYATQLAPDTTRAASHDAPVGEIEQVRRTLSHLSLDQQRQNEELQERKRRFAAFADSLPHLVFEIDADGKLEYVNQQWIAQFGLSEGMALEHLVQRMPEDDRKALFEPWEAARQTGEPLDLLARFVTAESGTPEWFRMRALPVTGNDGKVLRWLGTLSSVQDTMRAAEEVERLLAREQAAHAELARTNAMKDNFLATLSHELRTPLNVIGGWAQMLALNPVDPEYVLKGSRIIQKNIDLQVTMIDGLLDMSAIVAGKVSLDLQATDVAQLLVNVRDAFSKLAADKDVKLEMDIPRHPLLIEADPRRMDQVLANLVSNSLKFTDKGGRIRLTATPTEAGRVSIIIEDSGCGIDPEFLPHVFDRFRQQDSSISRKKGGVGLGLAIVKSLVDLQGGTIHARSSGIGKGCVFTMDFSRIETDANPDDPTADEEQRLLLGQFGNVRVLLIEDDEQAREVTRDALMALGAKVTDAADALMGWKILEAHGPFDVLVCDIGLPSMDGYQFVRRVRKSEDDRIAGIPSIALTAFAMPHDEIRAQEAGFDRHVPKPFSLAMLSSTMAELVSLNAEVRQSNLAADQG